MTDYDRRKALGAAIEALDAGSRELMLRFRQADGTLKSWDKAPGAPVTEADIASDRSISRVLLASGVGAGILSEESAAGDKQGLVWLVDPLCGTFPYRDGLAHWGLNVALRDERTLELGAIALPPTRDVFSAVRGAGVAHNGRRFEPTPPAVPLERSMICVEIDSADEWAAHAPLLTRLARAAGAINMFGSAAYPIAQLLQGRLSALVVLKVAPMHVAAGAAIASELGLVVSDLHAAPIDWATDGDLPGIVIAWPEHHAALMKASAGRA